jgi:hypothetical protein
VRVAGSVEQVVSVVVEMHRVLLRCIAFLSLVSSLT